MSQANACGKKGEDVELHRKAAGRLARRREAGCDQDSARSEVHLPHAGLDQREQQARVQLEHVVRDAGQDAPRPGRASRPPSSSPPGRRAGTRSTRPRRAVEASARGTASSAPRDASRSSRITGRPPRALRADDLRRLAVDVQRRAHREARVVLAGVLDEERAVEAVRLADAADPDEVVGYLRPTIWAVASSRVTDASTFSAGAPRRAGQSLRRNASATRSTSSDVFSARSRRRRPAPRRRRARPRTAARRSRR